MDTLEENFENLRLKLKKLDYLPRVAEEKGEHIIYIIHKPEVKKRSIWVNIILLILTIITTTWAGALLWFSRMNVENTTFNIIEPLLNLESVTFGFLSFALPLMIILGTHETAHYLAAKRHNIEASLPYFIPLPPPFILGTMGAFISMREPISNKKALLDIGSAGPIAGFIVSIPILIIGFILESLNPITISEISSDIFVFNPPLLFTGLRYFFPAPENSLMHPTAFAGWVGLFVTALNLIPGGQLDGGHISRALLGENAKYLSLIVIFILFALSFITQFLLWIIFAFFILLLGTSHPPPLNDISKLGHKRQAIGAFCMAMLLLCIHYAPITEIQVPRYGLEFECENPNQVVTINGTAEYFLEVTNTGESNGDVEFSYIINSTNTNESKWNSQFELLTSNGEPINNWKKFNLDSNDFFIIRLEVKPNKLLGYSASVNHYLKVTISGMSKVTEIFKITTQIGTFDLNTNQPSRTVIVGNYGRFNITVRNLENSTNTIDMIYNVTNYYNTSKLNLNVIPDTVILGPYENDHIDFIIDTSFNSDPGELVIELLGRSRLNSAAFDTLILTLEIKNN
jgi:hypothetical protein